jgi:hypothetical protein
MVSPGELYRRACLVHHGPTPVRTALSVPTFEEMVKSMKDFPNADILASPALVGVERPKFMAPAVRFYTGD